MKSMQLRGVSDQRSRRHLSNRSVATIRKYKIAHKNNALIKRLHQFVAKEFS